jgi:hypothetical protein
VFEKYEVGVLVENNPVSIAKKINELSKYDNSVFIENCKNAALEYNWENQEKILLDLIQ